MNKRQAKKKDRNAKIYGFITYKDYRVWMRAMHENDIYWKHKIGRTYSKCFKTITI